MSHSPRVSIVSGSFAASDSLPMLGQSVQLRATVLNSGPAPEPALRAEVWDRSTGALIAQLQRVIQSGEAIDIDALWQPVGGGVHSLELRVYSDLGVSPVIPAVLDVAVVPGGLLDVGDPQTGGFVSYLRTPAPNPFTTQTTVEFSIAKPGPVELVVFDVRGRVVRRLIDEARPTGPASVVWNGKDEAGRRVGSGVYFVRLLGPQVQLRQKMVLLGAAGPARR